MSLQIESFFDADTFTLSYVVFDPESKDALVIDPVLNYHPQGVTNSFESIERILKFCRFSDLKVSHVLETHVHADHLSGAQYLKKVWPDLLVGISRNITIVQKTFAEILNPGPDFAIDGSQFDLLLQTGLTYQAGSIGFEVLETPGHTPACVTYKIGDSLFTGDTLFMPDSGTGRCDFPGGNSTELFQSITDKIYTQPDSHRIFVGHDYLPGGRDLQFETTVGAQKEANIHLSRETEKSDFIQLRNERDKTLKMPKLLFPSIEFNLNAGRLPQPDASGKIFFRFPVNFQEFVPAESEVFSAQAG